MSKDKHIEKWYEKLEPKRVYEIFDDISQIPRGTGNMDAISEAVLSWLKKMGCKAVRDKYCNVKAWKPATKGYEKAPGIMFSAHMDMVCNKVPGVKHNFMKDPIDILVKDNDIVYANGTTLGADDGLGMAFILSIFERNDIPHPALEAIFTTDEETDMNGALSMDYSDLKSKLIISLDGDPIAVGCLGEIDCNESFEYKTESIKKDFSTYKISVSGLMGGHSGVESTKERANAAMYLNRILMAINKKLKYQLVDICTGFGKEGRSTAFAYLADATVAFDGKKLRDVKMLLSELQTSYREELLNRDSEIVLTIQKCKCTVKAMKKEYKEKLITLLCALPDGVFTMSKEHEHMMDSSVNTGVVYLEDSKVKLQTTIRSALKSRKYYLWERIQRICDSLDVEAKLECDLPEWPVRVSKDILKLCHQVYPEHEEIVEEGTAEPGIFCDRMPNAAVVALQAPYSGAHSATEQFSAKQAKKYYDRLVKFIGLVK